MQFLLDIEKLQDTIKEYNITLNVLNEQKNNIENIVSTLTNYSWSGKTKDVFQEDHKEVIKNNELKYTSFSLCNELAECRQSVNKQIEQLEAFSVEFEKYYSGIDSLETNVCSRFGDISGITSIEGVYNDTFFIGVNGVPNVNKVNELLRKEKGLEYLTDEEKQILKYIKNIIGEEKYNKLKESYESGMNVNNTFENMLLSKYITDEIDEIEFEKEKIVVSGNNVDGYAARNFLETAIKQIKDWKAQDNSEITWMVVKNGYSDADIEQIKKAAKKYGVNLKFIDSQDDLVNHINSGYDRDEVKISDISIFAHGLRDNDGTLALNYEGTDELNITSEEIKNSDISRNAFQAVHTYFAACNIGTRENDVTSFAEEWIKKTGGDADAVYDPTPKGVVSREDGPVDNPGGQSDYGSINDFTLWSRIKDKLNSIMGVSFDINGCDNYPTIDKEDEKAEYNEEVIFDADGNEVPKNQDVYWENINEYGDVEKIDSGGPR